jgi:phospholipid/cholesterol/gamma-HCH transport system substrate-binding protein
MNAYRRNVMIGATVLGSLIVLIWMLVKFGGDVLKPFAPPSIKVSLKTSRADGVAIGSQVYYRGVAVGKVIDVNRLSDNVSVEIIAEVESIPPLPENVEAHIRQTNLLGGNTGIALEVPEGETPAGQLKSGTALKTMYVGLDVLPRQFASLAEELRLTAKQFRESNIVGGLDQQIKKVGSTLDSMQTLLDDPKMREDLKQSIANFRTASEKATTVATNAEKFTADLPELSKKASGTIDKANTTLDTTTKHVDTLAKSVSERLSQVATTLDSLNSIVAKIDKGDGTAAKLINDPKMYQNLLETTDQLNTSSAALKRLLEQWEQEGVSLKLK